MKYSILLFLFLYSCSNPIEETNNYFWPFYYVTQGSNHELIVDRNHHFTDEMKDTIKVILDNSGINWAIDKKGNILVPVNSIRYSDMNSINSDAEQQIRKIKNKK